MRNQNNWALTIKLWKERPKRTIQEAKDFFQISEIPNYPLRIDPQASRVLIRDEKVSKLTLAKLMHRKQESDKAGVRKI
jgi:hypothetical protein